MEESSAENTIRRQQNLIQTVLCAVLQCIPTTIYTPPGIRTMYTDAFRGAELTDELLSGHPGRIFDMTRLRREVFLELLNWLCQNTELKDSRHVSAAEKLVTFLFICAHAIKFRIAAETFQHSIRTIHLSFHEVLKALVSLHQHVVKLPSDRTPDEIEQDDKAWPYFADCVGALDGTHIEIWVPQKTQARWRNRKGQVTQNVLAACDFRMNFVYVFPGWEGSAHDGRVLADAKAQGFEAPPGKYYLADSGYSNSDLTLTPYPKVRYHLREYARGIQKPQNGKELFNLRHASLRNVIERTFGVLKARFVILQKAPRRHSIRSQVYLVFALTAVHNFMNSHGYDPEAESRNLEISNEEDEEDEEDGSDSGQATIEYNQGMNPRRDEMTEMIWDDYQVYQMR